MQSAFARRRVAGLTLIELLVALAVFAVLGTLTWRGSSQMIDTNRMVSQDLEHWRAINRALQIMELNLIQAVARPSTEGAMAAPALALIDGPRGSELTFRTLSGDVGVQRVSFRLAGDQWMWIRRSDDIQSPEAQQGEESDVLLSGVKTVSWRFLGTDGWVSAWPPEGLAIDELPAGVELRLNLVGLGAVSRIYALR